MNKLLVTILGILLVAMPSSAFAACYGSSNFETCTDDDGNSYTVNRFGNTTMVAGNNYSTGNHWSETTQQMGNMAFTNGTAANGQSWNMTEQHIGNMETYNGTNAQGAPFSYTCTQYGCSGY